MGFTTVARPARAETVVKGSRFLARVAPAETVAAALAELEAARRDLPDASHHCWAYRVGREMRFSDDGEPAGTAGRPQLEVLLKRDFDRVVVVVSRFFGGTKLGAGGLVRAYSGAAARALDKAGMLEVADRIVLGLTIPFAAMDPVLRLLEGWPDLQRGTPHYTADGLELQVDLPLAARNELAARLADLSRGTVRLRTV